MPRYKCNSCGNELRFYSLREGITEHVQLDQRPDGTFSIVKVEYTALRAGKTSVHCQDCYQLIQSEPVADAIPVKLR